MKSILKESNNSQIDILENILPQTQLRIIKKTEVIFELNELPITKSHSITYQEKFHNILEHHLDYLYVFTDGSKGNDKTACAAVLIKQ